jgi:hypothetical protein
MNYLPCKTETRKKEEEEKKEDKDKEEEVEDEACTTLLFNYSNQQRYKNNLKTDKNIIILNRVLGIIALHKILNYIQS